MSYHVCYEPPYLLTNEPPQIPTNELPHHLTYESLDLLPNEPPHFLISELHHISLHMSHHIFLPVSFKISLNELPLTYELPHILTNKTPMSHHISTNEQPHLLLHEASRLLTPFTTKELLLYISLSTYVDHGSNTC